MKKYDYPRDTPPNPLCKRCIFHSNFTRTCDYILIAGNSRKCSVQTCDKYAPRILFDRENPFKDKYHGGGRAVAKPIQLASGEMVNLQPILCGGRPKLLQNGEWVEYGRMLMPKDYEDAVTVEV